MTGKPTGAFFVFVEPGATGCMSQTPSHAPIALPIALGKPRNHVPSPRFEVSARPHGLAFGVTDGARTRDLRSHKWTVGAPGAVGAGLWRVRECPESPVGGGLQCGCSTDTEVC